MERGAAPDDDHVRRKRHHQSTAGGRAMHERDDRLRTGAHRLEHVAQQPVAFGTVAQAVGRLVAPALEVGARTEAAARAADEDDARFRVTLLVAEIGVERVRHRLVQRIEAFRPIENEVFDRAVAFRLQDRFRHAPSSPDHIDTHEGVTERPDASNAGRSIRQAPCLIAIVFSAPNA